MASDLASSHDAPPPSRPDAEHPFADANVAFAIDVSGSTRGPTLHSEQMFVQGVADLLSPARQSSATIAPWATHEVKPFRGLDQLYTIRSSGGTNPATLFMNQISASSIENASLWFLLTDGLIPDENRQQFTNIVTKKGLHGTSCITIIFGTTHRPPVSCNISVGVSVYAMCPNSAFLYYDTTSHDIIILQSKGIFNVLLQGAENPVINNNTTWKTLPRLSLQSLSDIVVPPPKRLSIDEIALDQGSTVINVNDLFANKLSQETIDRIFSNDDSLATITMAAQVQGQVQMFQGWAQQQQMPSSNPVSQARIDLGGAARAAFTEILALLKTGKPAPEELKQKLRDAHVENMKYFLRGCQSHMSQARVRDQLIQSHSARAAGSITSATALSSTKRTHLNSFGDDIGRAAAPTVISNEIGELGGKRNKISHDAGPSGLSRLINESEAGLSSPSPQPGPPIPDNKTGHSPDTAPVSPEKAFADTWGDWTNQITSPELRTLLYTPKFRVKGTSFRGTCSICGSTQMTLAWLFYNNPRLDPTLAHSFPFAAGASPEFNVLSPVICCEPCSTYCVSLHTSPKNEAIHAALPMVEYEDNAREHIGQLQQVLGFPRIYNSDVLQTFISMLLTAATRETSSVFHKAVEWACLDMARAVERQGKPSIAVSIKQQFQDLNNAGSQLIQYPLQGFMPLLRMASLLGISAETTQTVAFHRFLFLVTEALSNKSLAASGMATPRAETVMDATKKLIWQEAEDPDLVVVLDPESDEPDQSKSSEVARSRALSLPMQSLRGTPLLSDETFDLLQKAEEFRTLASAQNPWVGYATAVFVHALLDVAEKHDYNTAADLFKIVSSRKELAPIFGRPKDVDLDDVVSMLKSLQL